MKDMGQSASHDALAPQISEPHQPAVSNSEQGAVEVISQRSHKIGEVNITFTVGRIKPRGQS